MIWQFGRTPLDRCLRWFIPMWNDTILPLFKQKAGRFIQTIKWADQLPKKEVVLKEMKEYPNSNLTLNDLLQDLNRHAVQIKFILRELESRGCLSNGVSLIWGYISEFFSVEERQRISPK